MTIKATDVKNLREKTGLGMMECKKALEEANGDFELAKNAAIEGINDVEKLLINHTEAIWCSPIEVLKNHNK